MASGGKKKTTMAKLDRERRMREKRTDKLARKDARKQAMTELPDGAPAADESATPSWLGERPEAIAVPALVDA